MKRNIIFTIIALLATIHLMADNQRLVGTIDVNATVSESGGAVVSIPIDIPAGINGMQPNLALVYNSQGGLGIAGWGWDLSGLSSISRTGRDFYHDGESDGVHVNATDSLALDGQRLVLKNGTYWGSDSEYQTEIESFNRVKYMSGNGFIVQAKDGITSKYGDTTDSRLTDDNNHVLNWYLSEIRDLNGNYVSYTYTRSSTGGLLETTLSSIAYTGNGSTVVPAYTIVFSYTALQHPRISYVEAIPAQNGLLTICKSKILSKITIKLGSRELYSYNLSYDNTSGMEPRLNYVEKKAANGDSYASNVITWNSPSMVTSNDSISMVVSKKNNFLYADFTGNGRTDILSYSSDSHYLVLYKNNSNGSTASFTPATIDLSNISSNCKFSILTILDFNGDGKMDIAGVYKVGLVYHARCLLSNGNGFVDGNVHTSGLTSRQVITGDFDGDGMDEIIFTN